MDKPNVTTTLRTPITWLIPIKNGMPYLPRMLASIERQTYRDFQVIAWDNGSTDGTVDVLRQWIPRRLPGWVVADRPLPFGSSLAAMVELATTELCVRIDADDINEPQRLATQLRFLAGHPEVAVLGGAMRHIDTHDRLLPDRPSPVLDDAEIRWRLRFCNALNHPTVIFRRSAVLAAGNYRDALPAEDYELWLRMALKYRMANVPEPVVRYRVHGASLCAIHQDRIETIRGTIRQQHAAALLPGLDDESRRELYERLDDPERPDVALRHCLALRRTARLAAREAGERADYFSNTTLYRIQRRGLVLRWLKSQAVIGGLRARLGSHSVSTRLAHAGRTGVDPIAKRRAA